jgi:23S rRNA (uracil-5-)-methyltransferase RumA
MGEFNVAPKCPYFGECGGCSSQHISYDEQLNSKRKKFASIMNLDADNIKVFSDKEYYYRNRMDFIFHAQGGGGLGLRKKGDWKSSVDIKTCAIANNKLNVLLNEIRSYFKGIDSFDVRKKIGTYRYAVIRTPGIEDENTNISENSDSSISFVLNEDSPKLGDAIDKIKSFAKITTAKNVIITYVPKDTDNSISREFYSVKGTDMLHETYLSNEFSYSVQGFSQNNTKMAQKMHEYVHDICKKHSELGLCDYSLLDLYSGVGTFGINNSKFFKKTYLIESDKNCVDAAKINIENNKMKHVEIYELDAMQFKKIQIPDSESKKLFLITDPPRSGMHPKTIDHINKLKPKIIVYISCNVEQLGKDLPKLKGYELKNTAMFDLFPQTPHIEGIVELVLKDNQ